MTCAEPRDEVFLLFDPLADYTELPSMPWLSTDSLGFPSHRPARLLPLRCCLPAIGCPPPLLEIRLEGVSGSTIFLKVLGLERGVVASCIESRVRGSSTSPLLPPGYSHLQQIFKILIAIIIKTISAFVT